MFACYTYVIYILDYIKRIFKGRICTWNIYIVTLVLFNIIILGSNVFILRIAWALAQCLKTCKSLHLGPYCMLRWKHTFPRESVAKPAPLAHMAALSYLMCFLMHWPALKLPYSLCECVCLMLVINCIPWKLIDVLVKESAHSWLPSPVTSATVSGWGWQEILCSDTSGFILLSKDWNLPFEYVNTLCRDLTSTKKSAICQLQY